MANKSLSFYFSAVFLYFTAAAGFAQNTLLYSFTKNNEKPSYLFGTIHIKDIRAFVFNDSLFLKLNECSAIALELDLDPKQMIEAQRAFLTTDTKPLSSYFNSNSDYQKFIKKAAESTGFTTDILTKFKPFAIISMMTQQSVQANRDQTVDEFLYNYGKEKGKRIIGLETIEEQISVTEKIPSKDYMKIISAAKSDMENEMEELISLYEKGNVDELSVAFEKEMNSEFWTKEFIIKRNHIITKRIDSLLNTSKTTIFTAIGAGHLGGKEGVLNLLKEKGYTVKPVLSSKKPVAELLEKPSVSWDEQMRAAGFFIDMPGHPTVEVNEIPFGENEHAQMSTYKCNDFDGDNYAYVASEMKFPKNTPISEDDIKPFIESVIKGISSSINGKTLSKKTFTAKDQKIQELEIQFMDKKSIDNVRIVFTNNGLYVLQVICSKDKRKNKSIETFFNSLRLQL